MAAPSLRRCCGLIAFAFIGALPRDSTGADLTIHLRGFCVTVLIACQTAYLVRLPLREPCWRVCRQPRERTSLGAACARRARDPARPVALEGVHRGGPSAGDHTGSNRRRSIGSLSTLLDDLVALQV